MNNGLDQKSVLVTGPAGAPCHGIVLLLAHEGASVVALDLNDQELNEPVVEIESDRTMVLSGVDDVSDEVSRGYYTDQTVAWGGPGGTATAALPWNDGTTATPRQQDLTSVVDLPNDHGRPSRRRISVPEAVDVSNASALLRTLCQAIDHAPDGIEVDMSTADFVGVAGWRALLRSARYAADRSPFTLTGLSARHRRTAELLGLTAALRVLEPLDGAGIHERSDEPAPAEPRQR